MSIDANTTPGSETPENEVNRRDLSKCILADKITPELILKDLEAGRTREDIRKRYAYIDEDGNRQEFEKWMVDRMFQDPMLKGKKPSKKRALPFEFVSTAATPEAPKEETPATPTDSAPEDGADNLPDAAAGELPEDPQADAPQANAPQAPIELG